MATKLTEQEVAWITQFGLEQGPGRKLLHLRQNMTLFNKGSPIAQIFLILRGQLKVLAISAQGKTAVHEIVGRHGWLAEEAMNGLDAHHHTAVAIAETEALAFERATFPAMLEQHAPLRGLFMRGLARHLQAKATALDEQLFSSAAIRFARILLGLFMSNAEVIELKTTQDQLAEMIGATRQTVNQIMKTTFAASGIITKEPGKPYRLHKVPLERFLDETDNSEGN